MPLKIKFCQREWCCRRTLFTFDHLLTWAVIFNSSGVFKHPVGFFFPLPATSVTLAPVQNYQWSALSQILTRAILKSSDGRVTSAPVRLKTEAGRLEITRHRPPPFAVERVWTKKGDGYNWRSRRRWRRRRHQRRWRRRRRRWRRRRGRIFNPQIKQLHQKKNFCPIFRFASLNTFFLFQMKRKCSICCSLDSAA